MKAALAADGRTAATLTLRYGGRHTTWPLAEISINNRGVVLYDPGPLDVDTIADRILGDILFRGGVGVLHLDLDRGKLAQLLAELRQSCGEEIAQRLIAEADDEARRPNRDAVSRAIETWMREAADIAREPGAERP